MSPHINYVCVHVTVQNCIQCWTSLIIFSLILETKGAPLVWRAAPQNMRLLWRAEIGVWRLCSMGPGANTPGQGVSRRSFSEADDILLIQPHISAFIFNLYIQRVYIQRVDYCNVVFAGAPKITNKLQRVLNSAARVVSGTRKFDRGLRQWCILSSTGLTYPSVHTRYIPGAAAPDLECRSRWGQLRLSEQSVRKEADRCLSRFLETRLERVECVWINHVLI